MTNLLVAVARDEAPFLLQWVAWHRMIGFDAVLVFTNDCSDETEPMLERLQDLGLATWIRNPVGFGEGPQRAALAAVMDHPLYNGADWVAHFDLDEYLLVRVGDGSLSGLLERVAEANMVSVSWRNFGDSGRSAYAPGLLVEQFTWCAPRYLQRPRQLTAFKTLHRPLGHWAAIGAHRPYRLRAAPQDVRWVNGDGAPMPARFLDVGWQSEPGCFGDDLVQLNHYAIKDRESFVAKAARGAPRPDRRHVDFDYWCLRNINFERDLAAQGRADALRAAMAELTADPVLADLQMRAEAGHRARIDALRADPAFAPLFDRLAGHVPNGSYTRMTDGDRVVHAFTMPDVAVPSRVM